jgi:hypothetical protein
MLKHLEVPQEVRSANLQTPVFSAAPKQELTDFGRAERVRRDRKRWPAISGVCQWQSAVGATMAVIAHVEHFLATGALPRSGHPSRDQQAAEAIGDGLTTPEVCK